MKKILLLAINWYIKSCKHLSLYSVYIKIARKTGISLSLLRKLENSMIRTVMRFMDINYPLASITPDLRKVKIVVFGKARGFKCFTLFGARNIPDKLNACDVTKACSNYKRSNYTYLVLSKFELRKREK